MEGLKTIDKSKSKSQRKGKLSKDKKSNSKHKLIADTRKTLNKNKMFDSKPVPIRSVDKSDQDSVSTNSEFTTNRIHKDFSINDNINQNESNYIKLPVITNSKSNPVDSRSSQERNKLKRRYKNASMRINDYPGGAYGSQNSIATTHTGKPIFCKTK